MLGGTVATLDTEIDEVLTAVSRYLEGELGRTFNQDAAVITRSYMTGSRKSDALLVHDIATKTGLVVKVDDDGDGNVTEETALTIATDFVPRGEDYGLDPELGPEPRPWVELWIPSYGSPTYSYWPVRTLVQVTAKGGWPAVPKAVKHSTIQIGGIWLMQSPRATSRLAEGLDAVIGTSREAQTIVRDLTSHYRRRWSF